MKLRFLPILLVAATSPLLAQDKPNSLGISFHHVSLVVPDYDANIVFWTEFGGVQQVMTGRTRFSAFHFRGEDVVVTVMENSTNSGGSVGSVVDHFGFQVPNVATVVARLKAAGIRVEANPNGQQAFVYTPDNVKIELLQDATLQVALKPQHIHFFIATPLAARAWYVKMFGAVPGRRGRFDVADIPDMDLTFSKATGAVAPTKGRVLEHIGFAVDNLQDTEKRLESNGVKFEQPLSRRGPGSTQIAFFVDPWGTRVELIQLAATGQ